MEEDRQRGEWFTLQVLSNQEGKVRDTILRQLQLQADAVPVYDVCIPTGEVSDVKQGRRKTREQKMYPGYVFVRMELYDPATREIDENAWYFVKNIAGVISFMGGDRPMPLSEQELLAFPPPMGPEVHAKAIPQQMWKVGDHVVINNGAFEGFDGVITAVDDERQRLTIEVVIFDRKTPAELEFWQVEPAE